MIIQNLLATVALLCGLPANGHDNPNTWTSANGCTNPIFLLLHHPLQIAGRCAVTGDGVPYTIVGIEPGSDQEGQREMLGVKCYAWNLHSTPLTSCCQFPVPQYYRYLLWGGVARTRPQNNKAGTHSNHTFVQISCDYCDRRSNQI